MLDKLKPSKKQCMVMAVMGTLGALGALAAVPFTGGTSLLMYGAASGACMAGMGVLGYGAHSAREANSKGKKPSTLKTIAQFFTGMLKALAVVGLLASALLAILAIPFTFGGSVAFLATAATALTPLFTAVTGLFGSIGLGSLVGTAGLGLLKCAGYVAGSSLITGIIAKIAHKGLTRSGGSEQDAEMKEQKEKHQDNDDARREDEEFDDPEKASLLQNDHNDRQTQGQGYAQMQNSMNGGGQDHGNMVQVDRDYLQHLQRLEQQVTQKQQTQGQQQQHQAQPQPNPTLRPPAPGNRRQRRLLNQ